MLLSGLMDFFSNVLTALNMIVLTSLGVTSKENELKTMSEKTLFVVANCFCQMWFHSNDRYVTSLYHLIHVDHQSSFIFRRILFGKRIKPLTK